MIHLHNQIKQYAKKKMPKQNTKLVMVTEMKYSCSQTCSEKIKTTCLRRVKI